MLLRIVCLRSASERSDCTRHADRDNEHGRQHSGPIICSAIDAQQKTKSSRDHNRTDGQRNTGTDAPCNSAHDRRNQGDDQRKRQKSRPCCGAGIMFRDHQHVGQQDQKTAQGAVEEKRQ